MSDAETPARLREALEEQLRLREEQARLQDVLIERLNLELREDHRLLVEQGDRKTELDRLLKLYGEHVHELMRGNAALSEQLKACGEHIQELTRGNAALSEQLKACGEHIQELTRGNAALSEQLKGCAAHVERLNGAYAALTDQKNEADRLWSQQVAELKDESGRLLARYQALHSPPPSGSLGARLLWGTSRIGGVLTRLLK